MNEHPIALNGAGLRIAIVASRFNDMIVRELVAGARDRLTRLGVAEAAIDLVWVPGAYEIPFACKVLADSRPPPDAMVTVGAVIRGATAHFEYVAGQCASGLQRVSLDTGVPIAFGVLTTDTVEQAIERAGTKAGNKGAEAAEAAVEMARLAGRPRG